LKKAAAVGFQYFGYAPAGGSFHKPMLPIPAAQAEYFNAAVSSGAAGEGQANERSGTDDIQGGENNQQAHDQSGEVPDILRPQAAELDAFVDAFIDGIDAVVHDSCALGVLFYRLLFFRSPAILGTAEEKIKAAGFGTLLSGEGQGGRIPPVEV
jgi:hypothetical protein